MLLQEFIDRSVQQAKQGLTNPPVTLELTANSLLPQVFTEAARRVGPDVLPRVTKTLSFTNGVAAFPADVLSTFLSDSVLYDSADTSKEYAYVEQWGDFVRVYDTRIGHYTGPDDIFLIEPGVRYAEGSGVTGARKLVVVAVPAVPSSASTAIDAPTEFVVVALDLLVERLKGAPPA